MAKVGKLAGLAALGALAYMNRDKLGMGDKKETNTGDETDRLLARKPAPLKTPEESISERMVKPDNTGENYSNEGLGKGINQANASGTTTLGPAYNQPSKPSAAPKSKAKGNIVSMSQMNDYKQRFGQDKTLRDYMNSQRASKNEPIKPVQLDESYKRGGMVKKMASGGMTASRRADGIATKGKTRGKIC